MRASLAEKGITIELERGMQVWSYFLPAWNRIYTSFSEAGTGVCYSGTTHEVYPPNRGGAGAQTPHLLG